VLKWAEEGYTVVQISAAAVAGSKIEDLLTEAVKAIERCDACQPKDKVGVICKSQSFTNFLLDMAANYSTSLLERSLEHRKISSYEVPKNRRWRCICRWSRIGSMRRRQPASSQTRRWATEANWIQDRRKPQQRILLSQITGPVVFSCPYFDLEDIWEEHTYYEFADRSVEHTMSTMVQEPYVNHVPTVSSNS
jgi:carboxymethylenebutenolidase